MREQKKKGEGHPTNRKGKCMKNSTLLAMVKILNGEKVDNFDEVKAEVLAEAEKLTEKANAVREAYDAAKPIVLAHLSDTPVTIAELVELCGDELPEDFTRSKVQYAFLHYWQDEVEKHENGRNAYTYTRREKG